MISKELSVTLGLAVREAKKRRHEYVCVEHILFAILYDSVGIEIIESCGGNIENMNRSLEEFFNEKLERVAEGNEYVLQQTIAFQRVIQRAVNHVRSAEKQEVEVSDILASIFLEKDSHASFYTAGGGDYPSGCAELHLRMMCPRPSTKNSPVDLPKPTEGTKGRRVTRWKCLRWIWSKWQRTANWIRLSAV